jgi:hypothetical protein
MNLRWLLLAASLLAISTAAQDSADDGKPATAPPIEIVVQNLAPYPRREWVQAVVPFAEGAVTGVPAYHVADTPTVCEPFGARWPDGSVRQAIVSFRLELTGHGEQRIRLAAGPGEAPPPFADGLPEHRIEIEVRSGGKTITAVLPPVEVLAESPARRVRVFRGRIADTGLVGEATLEEFSGQAHAWFGIGVFFSDPTTTSLQFPIDELAVVTHGVAFVPRHARLLGMRVDATDDGARAILLSKSHLGDGQGVRRVGVLLPPPREGDDLETRWFNETVRAAMVCRPLAATTWTKTDAFGPFGVVPPNPPWLQSFEAAHAAARRRHTEFAAFIQKNEGNPFRAPRHGLDTRAHRAGDQPDFGLVALEPVAATGLPSMLLEVEWSVMQEGCRPVHFFEADGTPLLARNHPEWVALSGRTHWNIGTSPDRLGKEHPPAKYDSHNWSGIDSEHWSNNYLCAFYQLTGDPSTLLEIRNQAQLWIAANTLDKRFYTSGPGAARAAGRTILSGCWLWLCEPDAELGKRIEDRMHQTMVGTWEGGKWPPGYVRPYDVKGPDIRYFPGDEPVWAPWEDALAVIGFEAYRVLFRDETEPVRDLIEGVALNLLEHAWRLNDEGRAEIGYCMKYFDGKAYTKEQLVDPGVVRWASPAFAMWGMGSLRIAERAALRQGNTALAQKAKSLLEAMDRARVAPRDGSWDRFTQWSAIR